MDGCRGCRAAGCPREGGFVSTLRCVHRRSPPFTAVLLLRVPPFIVFFRRLSPRHCPRCARRHIKGTSCAVPWKELSRWAQVRPQRKERNKLFWL